MGRLVDQTDVFIVGAGPAGLAAGIAARKKGFRVIAADCAVPPIDKTCGEGLMPDGLSALRQLGVTVNPEESFEFRGIRFLGSGTSVEAVFPFGRGLGVRRTLLHQILIDQAEAAGIPIRWGERITGITENAVQLVDGEIRCRWIVGADGENSRVRRWGGLDAVRRHSRRFGFRQHYSIEPWTDYMEIYWGDDSQIYVTPVARESVCVALISRDPHVRLSTVLPRCPDLCRRLAEAAPSDVERGAVSASRALRSVTRNHVALIGDASGSVDAITGEGLCLSFHQARALADAMHAGDLRIYEAEHRRLMRRPALMAALMLSLDRSEWLRRRALKALSSNPQIFNKLLAMHVGLLPNSEFVTGGLLPLSWRILKA